MLIPYTYDRRFASIAGRSQFYHGTSQRFTEFDLSRAGGRDFGDFGYGVYLTPKPTLAKLYARDAAKQTGGEPLILQVRVLANKPADLDDPKLQRQVAEATGAPFPKGPQTRPREEALAITKFLTSLGYDSAVARYGSEVVVFDPRKLDIERIRPEDEWDVLL